MYNLHFTNQLVYIEYFHIRRIVYARKQELFIELETLIQKLFQKDPNLCQSHLFLEFQSNFIEIQNLFPLPAGGRDSLRFGGVGCPVSGSFCCSGISIFYFHTTPSFSSFFSYSSSTANTTTSTRNAGFRRGGIGVGVGSGRIGRVAC